MDRCVDDRNDIMQGHEEDHPVIQLHIPDISRELDGWHRIELVHRVGD